MIPINSTRSEDYPCHSINLRDYLQSSPFSNSVSLSIDSLDITTLPESISELQEIDTLDITDTPLVSLPDTIGNLRNLERIRLINTSIRVLPESIGSLPLKTLTICNAPIASLPDSIGNINHLFLSLRNTQIRVLPNTVRNLFTLICDPPITLSPELSHYLESKNQIHQAYLRQLTARATRRLNGSTE